MGQFFALPSKDRLYLQVFLSLTPLTLCLSLYLSSYLPFALVCLFICLCLVFVFVFVVACLACVWSSVRTSKTLFVWSILLCLTSFLPTIDTHV